MSAPSSAERGPRGPRLFFLPAADGSGQRLCVHHAPAGSAPRASILYVHPLAEEMNKSRRMAALQSRALADDGCAVLQLDLRGCGDSSGDFADAGWQDWVDDVQQAARWLQDRHAAPLWLWGLRAGALLAVQAAARMETPCHFLFWQPAVSGKTLLQQFLRLKAAAGLQPGAGGAQGKGAIDTARQELAAGRCVDVAGYGLAPALAAGLEGAELQLPARCGRVLWLELSLREDAALLPASAARVQAWRAAGVDVHSRALPGPAFWQTQEIVDAPALIAATSSLLIDPAPGTSAR